MEDKKRMRTHPTTSPPLHRKEPYRPNIVKGRAPTILWAGPLLFYGPVPYYSMGLSPEL
jgi:hypothetical protein